MENNIVLIGFMGCGKSTVGKILAKKLNLRFCDSDTVIEDREGTAINAIFAEKGEGYFRALEKDTIRELSEQKGLVIATGGGAVMNPENVKNLRGSGVVFFLDVTPETVLNRLQGDNSRPLLKRADKESAVTELMSKRSPFYIEAAHHTVNADNTPEAVANQILELYIKTTAKP